MAKRKPDVIYDGFLDAIFVDFGKLPKRRPLELPITTTAGPDPFAYVDYVGRSGRIVGFDMIDARASLPEAFTKSGNEVILNPDFRFSTKLKSMKVSDLPTFSSQAEAARFFLIDTPIQQPNHE